MGRKMRIPTLQIHAVAVSLALVGLGCPPRPEPPQPPPTPDSGVPATCATTCDHWRTLGCDVAEPTDGGGTCEQVCENVQDSGVITWDLECRSTVAACEDIDSCER